MKSRKDEHDVKVLLQGSKWRSYGVSEEIVRGKDGEPDHVELVAHPGEVWIRYSHDVKEPWTKLDLRRCCKKKDRYRYTRGHDGLLANVPSEVTVCSNP